VGSFKWWFAFLIPAKAPPHPARRVVWGNAGAREVALQRTREQNKRTKQQP